jgi:ADP-ribose pyrophosphatase
MPTGGVKEGETLEKAAQRELAEEAGYHAGRLIHVSSYYTSKCICDETAHLYLGEELTVAEAPPDDTEFLQRRIFLFDEALRMALEGEIMDSMSVMALLLAARRRGE